MTAFAAPDLLQGDHVRLEPLQPAHADGLRAALAGDALSRCWYTSVPTAAGVDDYIAEATAGRQAGRALPFAVRGPGGDVVGCTRFYDLDPAVPRASIGHTWYAPAAQRTAVNTETKLLLLALAFETWRCLAVAFETSWFNRRSREAIARLGARQDGVLRNHRRHADGSPRDTVVFSIVDGEWPAVKRNLVERLRTPSGGEAG
ncbi:GNAT family N-acetyltransferase [Luteimonas sp. R10]|uniref:GNAT family N-acetyltransferase n=1 Tax=Luteimonas sp. R10 TaxID=3108176 RepID=UPI003085E7DA|nr:GNAT family protein [Luteimonas sp. R10]